MGGMVSYGSNNYNFCTDTGEQLHLTDLIDGTETEIKQMIVNAMIQEYPIIESRADILDNIWNYDVEKFDFSIDNGRIYICFDKYEIAEGAAGVFRAELNPSNVGEEDALLYFVEHCDTQYFSEADLAGFDADMCRDCQRS